MTFPQPVILCAIFFTDERTILCFQTSVSSVVIQIAANYTTFNFWCYKLYLYDQRSV